MPLRRSLPNARRSGIDPLHAGLSASDARTVLPEALPKAPPVRREGRLVPAVEAFLQDFVSTRGAMEVTSSEAMNPFAGGGPNNLYRCFIDLSFRLVAPQGYAALIHQDGHLGNGRGAAGGVGNGQHMRLRFARGRSPDTAGSRRDERVWQPPH